MCQSSTTRRLTGAAAATLVWLLAAGPIPAQPLAQGVTVTPDWRRIGNAAVDVSLTSVATGPVDRVWYSESGDRLLARTQSGNVFVTRDWETWAAAAGESEPLPAQAPDAPAAVTPEEGASVRVARGSPTILYALGRAVHRSDDGGLNWTNLTEYRRQSILGDGLVDLAVSPRDDDEIVVAGRYGIWRSVDGGLSWSGLNDLLPNLPVQRLLGLPGRGRGTRVLLDGIGEAEWAPGEKHAWRPVSENELGRELQLRRSLSATLGARILAVAASGDYLYAGSADAGRLWASSDRGLSWRSFTLPGAGPVERIFALPGNPRVALAALGTGSEPADRAAHVLRTTNGGIFWDDLTANLPDVAAHGITADAATGGVYVATDGGVFFTVADLLGAAPATDWTSLSAGLPSAAAEDVRLDGEANQLYVAVEGEGVFAAQAPHRSLAPAVVNAADLHARAASPGVLLSVLGGKVRAARAGQLDVPVLAAGDVESQIQVPFEVKGSALLLAFTTANGDRAPRRFSVGLPLLEASPAIFVDHDGTPMILDADSGVLLNAMTPAHSGSRIQILATGLGRVNPQWPTGLAAPLDNPPEVVAGVRVLLDRAPLQVTRATLAPGYVGFYLVEVEMPEIVNYGPAELYIEAGGQASNLTRVYVEP